MSAVVSALAMASWFLGLTEWIAAIVDAIGYPGIFVLMVIEGILTPIPSEFIMPFAGYLASQGRFNIGVVIVVGTAGAAIGNVVAYHIGAKVGRPLISRYGRFIRLGEDDLAWAESWFARYGSLGVLLGHAVPGIRSIISFPAGIGRMDLRRFVAFSTIGAAIWNTVLVVAGFYLVERWTLFAEATDNVDIYVVLAVLVILVGYIAWRKTRLRSAMARANE